MRAIGKIGKKWQKTRRVWFVTNPADHSGYWRCYICHRSLKYPELDHIQSRTRHPELRFELSNLAPICHSCNTNKGSLSLEEYMEKNA